MIIGYNRLHSHGHLFLSISTTATSSSWRLVCSSLQVVSSGYSWDCVANIFLRHLWSTTLSNTLCRIVLMECLRHSFFRMVYFWSYFLLCSEKHFFLIGLSISKYAIVVASSRLHMHTYMISQIFCNCIFWIKIIFLPKYLTSSN